MSGDPLSHQQSISQVSVQQGSRAYVGTFSGCRFDDTDASQTLEKAAVECRNALFLTDPYIDRESIISAKGARVPGTCEWITHDETYRIWLESDTERERDRNGNSDTRLLWISGGPGKGKTMLSVFLTEQLDEQTARIDNTNLVFFFCSAEDERRNTAVAVLRGLVHQILVKRPQLVGHALPYFETPERKQQTLSTLEALWIIFYKLITDNELGTMLCVLDGLDECEDSMLRILLPRLVSLFIGKSLATNGTFKLAIISRDLPGLRGCTMRVRLDPDNDEEVVSDIGRFVSARVQELSRIEGFDEDFRASVQTTLLKRAEGTFLWVGFAMYELSQKQTCSEILEALEDLPPGLPAIYSRMLLRIPPKKREISRAVLRWVTIAIRPLFLQELADAVDIQADPRMTVEQAVRDAVTLCGPLLKVQSQELHLVHQSARDYLLRKKRDSNVVLERFRLDSEETHLELTQKCLDYIAQSDLQHRPISLGTARNFPLLYYATIYWPDHAKNCPTLLPKLFGSYKLFLQKKYPLRNHWWHAYVMNGNLREDPCEPPPLLHIACILEVIPWVEALLTEESGSSGYYELVNEKKHTRTALWWAIEKGNEAIVRLLVEKGADLEAEDNQRETALHKAARQGREAIVRLLVEKGADLEAKDYYRETALHRAIIEGHEAIVQLLVEKGADLKAKNIHGETALHKAARQGHKAIVQLLLEKRADLEAKDSDGETALHRSIRSAGAKERHLPVAERRDEEMVRLLVNLGANINTKKENGWTVLHSAVMTKSEALIRLLIDNGADVRASTSNGYTVLHAAIGGGDKALVQLIRAHLAS